jgi:hypothetical protein
LSELTNFTVDIEVAVVPGIVSPGGQPMQGPVKCSKVSFHFGTTDNAAKKTIGEELMAKQLGAIVLVEEETSKGENQTQIKTGAWQVKILETEIESILELLKIEPDRWIVTTAIYPSQSCLHRNSLRIMLGNGRKAFSTPQQCSSITSFILVSLKVASLVSYLTIM